MTDKEVELLKDEDVITIGGIEIDFSVLGSSRTWTYDANTLTCKKGTTSDGYFYLKGQNGYVNGITELNKISEIYGKGKYAKSARSVNVDDVNKITGYVDNVYNAGTSWVDQTGNQVTYTLNTDGKIHYKGTKYPTTDTIVVETSFTYWTGSKWKKLASGESATLTNNYYCQ